VENRRRPALPVEASTVLRALVWREVAALAAAGGALELPDVLEHLKCTAARAGLIYAVDDFHSQAELAIARFTAGAAGRDRARSAWRSRAAR
jgi:hypothetical protein